MIGWFRYDAYADSQTGKIEQSEAQSRVKTPYSRGG